MTRFLSTVAPDLAPGAPRAEVGVVGIPYDGAVTYRSGAREGPGAIREASDSIESYCPKLDRDLEAHRIVDFGDLVVPAVGPRQAMLDCKDQLGTLSAERLLVLGGDHLVAYPPLSRALAAHPELQIFHIDAHTDLREQWEGEPFNHASVLRRAHDEMRDGQHLWSWGIRSGLKEEFELARNDPKITLVDNTGAAGIGRAQALASSGKPIYLTIDVDGIDPSEIPGTGTPEPDGLRFGPVEAAVAALGRGRLVGADIVELAPGLDPTGRSQVVVARLARTVLLALCGL